MTEEQKDCEYCHGSEGFDFGEDDAWFKVRRMNGAYYIEAFRYQGEDPLESERINFCPMCGRKLGKEGA